MNKNDYIIRLERKDEHREVENLVREAFWNVYRPGCLEHYVLHCLRNDPAFIPELDFVMERDGKLIGQNVFMRASIAADDGRMIPIMTMGPICIAPECKRQGYGKILLDYTMEKAAELGAGALCFEGNIDFYGKSGFTYASEFGVRYHGLPDGEDAFSYKRIDGPLPELDSLRDAIDAMPFMTERTFVELRGVDIGKLEEPESFISVLSDIPEYCTVAFVQSAQYEPDGRLKIIKALRGICKEIK